MKQATARTAAVLAVFAACLYLLRGLLPAIAWSGLLAVSTWPLHKRMVRRLGDRGRDVSAALLTAVAVVVLLLPLGWLVYRGVLEAPVLLRWWATSNDVGLPAPDWLASLPWVGGWLLRQWNEWLADPGALSETVHGMAGGMRFQTGRALLKQIAHDAMSVFFCVPILFFLYRDGSTLARKGEAALARQFGPLGVQTMRLAISAARGTVNGLVLVGLAVGVLMSVAYVLAGVPHPALCGLATGLIGILPFGAPVVLAGVLIYLFSVGASTAGVALGVFGGVTFFIADHFVRPVFIAGTSRLPLILALLGIVAGLETFGVLGIFLGPTLLAVLTAIWRELTEASPIEGTASDGGALVASRPDVAIRRQRSDSTPP